MEMIVKAATNLATARSKHQFLDTAIMPTVYTYLFATLTNQQKFCKV